MLAQKFSKKIDSGLRKIGSSFHGIRARTRAHISRLFQLQALKNDSDNQVKSKLQMSVRAHTSRLSHPKRVDAWLRLVEIKKKRLFLCSRHSAVCIKSIFVVALTTHFYHHRHRHHHHHMPLVYLVVKVLKLRFLGGGLKYFCGLVFATFFTRVPNVVTLGKNGRVWRCGYEYRTSALLPDSIYAINER